MSLAVIEIVPHWVPVAFGSSCTRQFVVSATYRLPLLSTVMSAGPDSSADLAAPPSPESPPVPALLPAIVYTSYGLMDWFHLVWLIWLTIWIRLFPVSAMYRFPPALPPMNTSPGSFRSEEVAAPPSL